VSHRCYTAKETACSPGEGDPPWDRAPCRAQRAGGGQRHHTLVSVAEHEGRSGHETREARRRRLGDTPHFDA